MSVDVFDSFARDFVNFLEYISLPEYLESYRVAIWVIVFLVMFLILAYLLKNKFWQDVR